MYQEDLKLENYAISVAHPPSGDRSRLCPVCAVFIASSVSSSNAFFLLKIFLQTNQKGTLPSDLRLGSWMSHAPLKTVGVDFICFVSSTELTSYQHVREDISLLR